MKHWEDCQYFSEQLMDAHPSFREDMASLNGKWRYLIHATDSPMPDGWIEEEYDDKKWRRLQVPCLSVPKDQTATDAADVCFRKNFILSKNFGSRKVILRLEHIDTCTVLWVNGNYIGMSRDSAVPQEFDITHAVHPERNVIAILVHQDSCVPADTDTLFGLPGSVSLYTLPSRNISDLQSQILWEEGNRPLLKLKIRTENADGFSARIALMDGSNILHYVESKVVDGCAYAQIPCPNVQHWSAETPKLYSVAVILWDGVANYHTRQLSIGFRRNAIQEGILTWNGKEEKLFGVSFEPGFIDESELEQHLKAIRDHNFNTVFLKECGSEPVLGICDKVGLYAILDSGFTYHSEHQANSQETDIRMSAAYAHHPCLVAWHGNPITDVVQSISAFSQMPAPDTLGKDRSVPLSGKPIILESLSQKNGPYRLTVDAVRSEKYISGVSFGKWKPSETTLRKLEWALQPIRCTYKDDIVTLTNHNHFLNVDQYDCQYVLSSDGNTITAKSLSPKAAPGTTISFPIETKYDIFKPGRYYLDLIFRDPTDGHTVSREQWPIAILPHIRDENPGGSIREETGDVLLRSMDATYIIGRDNGNLSTVRCSEEELLRDFYPLFVKSGTRSGSFRISSEWEKISDRKKRMKPAVFEVDHMTRTITVSYHIGSGVMQSYRLFSDGSLSMEFRLRTGKTVPQRLAVSCTLSEQFRSIRWFGLGPDDSGANDSEGRYCGIHEMISTESRLPCTKDPVYSLWLNFQNQHTLHIRSDQGLKITLQPDPQAAGTRMIVEQTQAPLLKPHTTYTLSFTMQAFKNQ